MSDFKNQIDAFLESVKARNNNEPEFMQAVEEVAETVIPFIEDNPKYKEAKILERIVEPERVLQFRVPWLDDNGDIQINRGFRVEFNSAIGPYKGGLRFHPSVNLSILKSKPSFEAVFYVVKQNRKVRWSHYIWLMFGSVPMSVYQLIWRFSRDSQEKISTVQDAPKFCVILQNLVRVAAIDINKIGIKVISESSELS